MRHLDHDRLVFLALGEPTAEATDADHVAACAECRSEIDSLRHVAGLGAQTRELRDLPAPPVHLWDGVLAGIAAEDGRSTADRVSGPTDGRVSTADRVSGPTADAAPGPATDLRPGDAMDGLAGSAPSSRPVSGRAARPAPASRPTGGSGGTTRPAGTSRPPTRRRRWPTWATTALTAVAALAVGVAGTLIAVRGADLPEQPAPTVVASAPLAAYGQTPPEATGDARVFEDGRLHLHVANLPAVPGYYEVWLIDPDTMNMFSVGTIRDVDALLPLPSNVDLSTYRLVDVSAESYDNKPAHSGDSLLRGTLSS
ncbi:anti-sigma factor [Plantactinospora sp. GCM10030261]|uniref:anti-sigma factor n=1 Tax=Plantactinospora sp. GCM10030261 TaxID=3273420 RepID=UPI00361B8B77